MATTLSATTDCSYCSSSYKDPRMLSCLHSYCLQCITKMHEKDATSITCPSCSHATPLPTDGNANSLPANIRLREEIEREKIIQRVISPTPSRCDSCNENNTSSVAYCKNCNHMLCTDCWNMHKKMIILKSHLTFALTDLKKKSQSEVFKTVVPPIHSLSMCPSHDDQKLDFYCTLCKVPVCVGCTIDKHSKDNGHTVQKLEKHVSQTKTMILQDIKGLPENKKQLEKLTKTIDETKKKIENRKHEVEITIHKAFAEIRQVIDQREKELLAENDVITVSKETRLSIQQEEAQCLMESIIQCHSLSSIATSEYSDEELLSIAHTLHNRAVSLHQQFTSTPLDVCVTPHVSVDVNTGTLADVLGSVVDSSATGSSSTAVIPRQRLGIGAEMKVRVVTRNDRGKEINEGGARVRGRLGRLSGNGGLGSLAIDNGNGTYLVSVIAKQIGQHQLSITVNGQYIQDNSFSLKILPPRDYTKLKRPVQTITGINTPRYIAFSDNGDMFVTSSTDHCIHVYDKRGNKKTTIGSEGSGKLQFNKPYGIDISGEVVYVAEHGGHRVHKLTTGGEFIGTFGEEGSGIGQLSSHRDIKISPDGKVYIADSGNHRVLALSPDGTISHVINGKVSGAGSFYSPAGIAFDLSGNVHVTGSSVTIFTPNGQFVHQYDKQYISIPQGIAIDPSGYSLVTNRGEPGNGSLLVFNTSGKLIHSVRGLGGPTGVSVSPDGSVWVADTDRDRLLKY